MAGVNITVRDFERAVGMADLASQQHFLVEQARETSWTKARLDKSESPYRFRLNISRLAKLRRCDRSYLSELQADLVARGIFVKDADGFYLINKNYLDWVDPATGSPLLDDDQRRFAESSRDLDLTSTREVAPFATDCRPQPTVDKGECGLQPTVDSVQCRPQPTVGGPGVGHSLQPPSGAVGHSLQSGSGAPIRNGREDEEPREYKKTSPSPLRPPDARGVVGVESFAVAVPTEPFRTTAELTAWASLAFPGHDKAGRKLELLAAKFTLPWTHEALLRAEIRDPEQPFLWCQKVLREWQASGGPDGDLDSDRATPRGAPARGPSPLTADDRARRAALRASKPERYDA